MKTAAQLFTCTLASAALLVGAASHATDVAELPLKASVLAKPNVMFGLDDSGSMDGEMMLPTNDGAFWWKADAGSHAAARWDATSNKPWFNAVGDATTVWKKNIYLFAIGRSGNNPTSAAAGLRTYGDAANDHYAVPPTAEFAFLRSHQYNPMYYNPAVTYKPWSPGHVGGSLRTFVNSPPAAARVHPLAGTTTVNLTVDIPASTEVGRTFMALPHMTLPSSGFTSCNGTTCTNFGTPPATTVPAGQSWRIAMAYYAPTYWLKETCTADGDSCVTAPDGATIKRYEIKAANYATTELYDAAMQNFANWFTYHRKRKLMLNAAIGQVLEPLTGLTMGMVRFNNRTGPTMYDMDGTTLVSSVQVPNRLLLAGEFYAVNGDGGTPTRETLNYIGSRYMGSNSPIQYSCQRNNAFIMTDGFANAGSVSPPTYNQATWGAGAPYETTYAGTLADIALSYYTVNLRSTLTAGRVPLRDDDLNPNLHMNTYAMTMGARGTIFVDNYTARPTDPAAWPNPTQQRNPTAVDDLWHATINGRGRMYLASTPEETALLIQAGMTDILRGTGAQSGVAVSTVNLVRGDSRAYFGTYDPSGWQGDVTANAIDVSTGVVSSTAAWSASAKLTARDWTTRVIASYDGSSGVAFTSANVGAAVNPSNAYGITDDVINYLRGSRVGEGSSFRQRSSLMGAVIGSEPFIDNDAGVLYVASGEGMLHAIDIRGSGAGDELWAFVPRAVLSEIGQTVERGYAFRTKLDGSPVVGKISETSKLLVAGMGAAGRGYYAIDVSSPRGLNEAGLAGIVKWEFPAATDSITQGKVGQTLGKPVIVKSSDDGYVVLVTSGYNTTTDGRGRMWMLDASTGAVIHEFTVSEGTLSSESGLTHITPFGEDDGTSRYVYGGDLLGNVWKFDMKLKSAPVKLAALTGPTGIAQPVTAAPEVTRIDGHDVIIVPTGRMLDITDFGVNHVQSIYAIKDGATLTTPRSSLVQQTYTRSTDTITAAQVDWATGRGWYMDLPAGEQANTRPALAFGAVAFVTNKNGGTDCSASSYLYVIDVKKGDKFAGADFVSTTVSATANATGVTAVVTRDGRARGLVQDFDGRRGTPPSWSPGPPQPAKSAWREVRQ